MIKKITIIACILLQTSLLLAQHQADDIFKAEGDIESILLNPYTGSVIIKDTGSVKSYDPDTKQVEWTVVDEDLSKTTTMDKLNQVNDMMGKIENLDIQGLTEKKRTQVVFVPESPYVTFSIKDKDVIVNALDGTVVFNAHEKGYKITETEYLVEDDALLVMALSGNQYCCIYYNLKTNKEKWQSNLESAESFLQSLTGLFKFKAESVTADKAISDGDNIYTSINSCLYRLDKNTGEVKWKTSYRISDFFLSQGKGHIIVLHNTGNFLKKREALNLINIENGQELWNSDMKSPYISYVEDWSDRVLVAHAKGMNFYSYATGKKMWKKDAKGNKIKQVIPVNENYLYVADKDMNLIDSEGKNVWKKTIKICEKDEDEVYYLNRIDNDRVFYLTDTHGNMVNYTSGKKIWKKDVKFNKKTPLLYQYVEDKNTYLVYNDKKLYAFDPNASEKKNEPFAKLKKIEDKTIQSFELFDWGVVLIGQSDVMGINFDGTVKYHHHYKEPGGGRRKLLASGVASSLLGTMSDVSAQTSAMKFASRDIQKGTVSQNTKNWAGVAAGTAATANVMAGFEAKAKTRYNALRLNAEYAFIIAKAEAGGAEIVKVNKETGEEVEHLPLDSNSPIYEVDQYNGTLFYAHKNELRIYTKK